MLHLLHEKCTSYSVFGLNPFSNLHHQISSTKILHLTNSKRLKGGDQAAERNAI